MFCGKILKDIFAALKIEEMVSICSGEQKVSVNPEKRVNSEGPAPDLGTA